MTCLIGITFSMESSFTEQNKSRSIMRQYSYTMLGPWEFQNAGMNILGPHDGLEIDFLDNL